MRNLALVDNRKVQKTTRNIYGYPGVWLPDVLFPFREGKFAYQYRVPPENSYGGKITGRNDFACFQQCAN